MTFTLYFLWLHLLVKFSFSGKIYMSWLFLVTCTFMYNALAIPLRAAFTTRYMNKNTYLYWLIADYVGDFIYILDILVFKPRLTYLTSGLIEVLFVENYSDCPNLGRKCHKIFLGVFVVHIQCMVILNLNIITANYKLFIH